MRTVRPVWSSWLTDLTTIPTMSNWRYAALVYCLLMLPDKITYSVEHLIQLLVYTGSHWHLEYYVCCVFVVLNKFMKKYRWEAHFCHYTYQYLININKITQFCNDKSYLMYKECYTMDITSQMTLFSLNDRSWNWWSILWRTAIRTSDLVW